jgi:hypothetical protein
VWQLYDGRAYRRCEHVAAPGYGSDQLLGIIAQRSANFDQTLREGVVHDRDIGPDRLSELTLAHQPAVVLHEIHQNLEWLGTQRHLFRATAQEAAVEIQREAAERVPAAGPFSGM